MTTSSAKLYYDASCGFCKKEIEHLRPRLEPQVQLIDISAPTFQTPDGYTLEDLLTRIHFFDGQRMQVGFNATLGYWRVAGMKKTVALLGCRACVIWVTSLITSGLNGDDATQVRGSCLEQSCTYTLYVTLDAVALLRQYNALLMVALQHNEVRPTATEHCERHQA